MKKSALKNPQVATIWWLMSQNEKIVISFFSFIFILKIYQYRLKLCTLHLTGSQMWIDKQQN